MKHYFITLFLVLQFISEIVSAGVTGKTSAPQSSPVTFLENKGQWPADILYQSISTPINVYFMEDGLSFAEPGEEIEDTITGEEIYPYLVWNMKFDDTNPDMTVNGEDGKESKLSYLYGSDTSKWVIHPPEYSNVKYKDIYDNVDLNFYGAGNNLKYDYILHPGSAINSIVAYFNGIQNLSVNSGGELEILTQWKTHVKHAPYSYQVVNGMLHEVAVGYVLIDDTTFGFSINGPYDSNYDLVIDPLFEFVWGSFTKATGVSNNINYCFNSTVDAAGDVYLTGQVDQTYPTTPGAYSGPGTIVPEIFVSKFSKDGSTLIYSTYISGSSLEMGLGIAVDQIGQAYISGYGWSNFTGSNTYPTTASAYQPSIYPSGGADIIFSVVNASGTGLVYSTWLGGSNDDEGYSIALDDGGMVYITGYTSSSIASLPVKATTIPAYAGRTPFVAKFDISQSGANSLVYLARIGGNGYGCGRSIAVNNSGNAFITGSYQEFSSSPPFPITAGAYNSTYNSGSDNMMAFAAKLSSTLPVSLDYCTYLAAGIGNAIAIYPLTNEAYIAGSTRTFAYPVTPGVLQPIHGQDALGNGNSDAFVTKLNAAGSSLVYSTFLGGEREDYGTGIGINSAGEAYVVGTASHTFPVSAGAFQATPGGGPGDYDYFAVQLNAEATGYGCGGSTYIGGDDMDYGTMMYDYPSPKVSVLDNGGINDTVLVSGTSHSSDFPTTPGAYSPTKLNSIADQPVFFNITCFVLPLPVELISFTGKNDGFENILEWTTASEINNDFFELERKIPGEDFITIAKVDGHGTTSEPNQYIFYDKDITPGATYYYRLKQMDFNGETTFSSIISVRSQEKISSVGILPNPFSENTEIILFLDGKSTVDVELLTVEGKKIATIYNGNQLEGKFNIILDSKVYGLNEGFYLIKVLINDKREIHKLVKS